MPPDVTVVIPTYNEAENLESITSAVRAVGFAVLVVDDNSPDGTGRIADEVAAQDGGVTVLHRPAKKGLGPAYAAGFGEARLGGASVICQMDADHSHDPASLTALVETVHAGADVAIGSRYVPGGAVPGWPLHRRALSKYGNVYARTLLGTSIRDMTSGFRAYRTELLDKLEPATCEASGYGFQVEMAARARQSGAEVVEVPITFRDRERGVSKMNWRIAAEAMWLVTLWGMRRRFQR